MNKLIKCTFFFILLQGFTNNGRQTNLLEELILKNGKIYLDPYWDGYNKKTKGNGWLIMKDKKMREYYYTSNSTRRFVSYRDVILDTMQWKFSDDTLMFDTFQFRLTKIKKDTLIFEDLHKVYGRKYLYFLISKNQTTNPLPAIRNW